jgi:hypothetical protein
MEVWLDPDSPTMGQWVDRWLHTIRQQGYSGRQLEAYSRHSGEALSTPHPRSPAPILAAFWEWVRRMEKMDAARSSDRASPPP